MTPEDVLVEAIAAASMFGDSPGLRRASCERLRASLAHMDMFNIRWRAVAAQRDDGREEKE